jgi:signal transduction histidine kinase
VRRHVVKLVSGWSWRHALIDRAGWLRYDRGWRAYALASGMVAAVAAARVALHGILGNEVPLLPFIFAVLGASVVGGLRVGLYATVLSTVAGQLLFVRPYGASALSDPAEALRCVIFVLVSVLVCAVIELLREARLDALRANEEKDAFIAMLAHEFRNPINAVQTAVAVMKTRQTDERRTWARDLIERQAAVMGRLVDDLLDAARIRRQAFNETQRQPTSIRSVLESAIASIQPLLLDGRLQFDAEMDDGVVMADPIRLQQALANLLANACRYTPPGGRVSVTVTISTVVHVTIRDTGIGISPADLPRLFEPFQRGPNSTGLGLGLYLARTFVQYSGGTLEAASSGTGRGSTFIVRLPLLRHATRVPEIMPGTRSA